MKQLISLIFFLFFLIPLSYPYNQYEVPCTPATPTCACPLMHNGKPVDACLFSLNIQVLQSFTSYYLPVQLGGRAAYGRPWHINTTSGLFLPLPGTKGRCGLNEAKSTLCTLDEANCTFPFPMDGYTYRSFISVNGQFPGPTLIAQYNQTLVINVTNWLEEGDVGIHWHGLHQRGTNWMDGVPGLTQCGIQPGQSFR